MPGFTKLFNCIISSTIWLEADRTRIVWITMLAMADRRGRVFASVPGLAKEAVVPVEDARKAIETFLAPDPDSRSRDHDGRRIEPVDGGWRLLNYSHYREKRDEDERREYLRIKKQEERSRDRQQKSTMSTESTGNQPIAEAEAEADIKPIAPTRLKTNRSEPTLFPDNHASVFDLGPLNDGSFFPIPQELCDQYAKSYPAVNIEQQFREMNAWLISNPKERKTRRGVPRFMNAWLAREQDKTPLPKPVRRAEFDREAWLKSRESE